MLKGKGIKKIFEKLGIDGKAVGVDCA